MANPYITANQGLNPQIRNFSAVGSNPASKIDAKSGNRTISQTTYPPDLGKYRFVIIEADVNMFPIQQNLSFNRMFVLPLPFGLTETHTTHYDTNFNFLDAGTSAVNSVTGKASGAAGTFGAALGSGAQAFGSAAGLTLNQAKMVTLKNPAFNQHKFAWKFSPKNFNEAETIRKMVYDLKTGMLPSLSQNTGRTMFYFPKIYLMYFAPNIQNLYKFKPCVLQNIQIDYQGNNPAPAFFESKAGAVTGDDFAADPSNPTFNLGNQSVGQASSLNAPESIVMHTTWLELEVWTQEDLKDKGDSTNPFDAFSWYTGV